jgi:putative ABC transport system ATP-binding protein
MPPMPDHERTDRARGAGGPDDAPDGANVVALRGVHKSVAEGEAVRTILAGVDLDVAAGEAVAVLGRSGSGKSTLLNLIAGIDGADRGAATPLIRTCGVDVVAASERERARLRAQHLGFVFQAFHLLPTLTVAENVALPLELAGARRAHASPRVVELLARVGLADRAAAWPDVLSGGEQQRVAVARALATRPRLVLCDEPTGNLDDAAAAAVLGLLHELRRESGCALLIVTHSERAAATCDRRLRLERGALCAAESPA